MMRFLLGIATIVLFINLLILADSRHPYWIVYSDAQLYRVTVEGEHANRLALHIDEPHGAPQLSPNEDWVAFVASGQCSPVVYRMNIADWQVQAITGDPGPCAANNRTWSSYETLEWSPSSDWLLWVYPPQTLATDQTPSQIFRLQADGGGIQQLTTSESHSIQPDWSSDGQKIAYVEFVGPDSKNTHLMLMHADGSAAKQLTTIAAQYADPVWAPDGTWIYYRQRMDNVNWNLYRMHPDGSQIEQLSTTHGYKSAVVWSPDGQSMLFASDHDGDREIYQMNPDGSGVQQLTRNGGDDERPVWSPDGEWIAFVSYRSQGRGLYVMQADGTNESRVTTDYGQDWYATWAPFPDREAGSLPLALGMVCTLLVAFYVYNNSKHAKA